MATTIGNHDSLNEDYMYHFNNPNNTENGKIVALEPEFFTAEQLGGLKIKDF